MKSNSMILIFGVISILLTDSILGYQIRKFLRKKRLLSIYIFHSLFFITAIILFHFSSPKINGPEAYFWIGKLFGVLLLFYTPKLLYVLINSLSICLKKTMPKVSQTVSIASKVIAATMFCILFYSITWGRYNYKTDTVEVLLNNLPKSFYGFKIVQLSDLHLGSYGESYQGIKQLVNQVNALQPDLVVFTGDMVNNFADEMPYWVPVLKQLKARYGKYAVTGNHDYGNYFHWATQEAKRDNLQRFYNNMQAMGFQMLNNTHVPIVKQSDTLWLAGVENWGKPPFPRYGNLQHALNGLHHNQSIILLSHDPSHWRAEILSSPVSLTLSGHTHAMQAGIQIGKRKWSPSKYIYPEYDGLYQEGNQYLYVSRGQGYIGYPGRIGLRPVITLLILK